MLQQDQIKKAIKLADQILIFSRDSLLISLRFLDRALYQFRLIHNFEIDSIGMNGQIIYYNYASVLRKYKDEKETIARYFLHMVFHCIFHHPFKQSIKNEGYWDIAADIATENAILELNIKSVQTRKDSEQQKIIALLKNNIKIMTAEKIYQYLLNHEISTSELEEYSNVFKRDTHIFWRILSSKGNADEADEEMSFGEDSSAFDKETAENWKKISEMIQTDLETFSKDQGTELNGLIQNIREVNRDRYDYTDFLKRFSIIGEDMQINDDEFDYVFYTYGLKLYEKMPLIEPLEYKEGHKIKNFVIAIDTSGSCSGELVQAFLNKTYSILKGSENFFRKVNIHIIQCDFKIQSDVKITNDEEFEDFVKNIQLKGFEGTDFRPVFRYVDDLIQKGEFDNLKGLIYFTDGYGTFPAWIPNYDVAFVFIDGKDTQPRVPVWAMKLVLQQEDIIG